MATRKQTTTKKPAAKKESSPVDMLLETCPYPVDSNFEIETFSDKEGAGFARHMINVVNRLRKVNSDLETETRTYERNCLEHEQSKLVQLLEQQDHEIVNRSIADYEQTERQYWVRYLGKKAAIEILTNNRVGADTMTMMVKLSEEDYKEVTQICVKLASSIQQATKEAEEEIGFYTQDPEEQQPVVSSGPRQLKLKKVKKAK